MKLFVDANIIVTVLNKQYPLFSHASRIFSIQDGNRFSIYTSPLCLAIAFYFAEKKSGTASALRKISLLSSRIHIAPTGSKEVSQTIANKQIIDPEDGLEYYSAMNSGCNVIITEDPEAFHFAETEVLNCQHFFEKYLPWNK